MLSLLLVVLGLTLLAWLLHTRRLCQRCDYCGRFYWWIGWAAFEWTSPQYERWVMRCKACRWLSKELHQLPPG